MFNKLELVDIVIVIRSPSLRQVVIPSSATVLKLLAY